MLQGLLSTTSSENACNKNYSIDPWADGHSKKKTKGSRWLSTKQGPGSLLGALHGWTHLALTTGPQSNLYSHPCSIHEKSRAQYLARVSRLDGAGSSVCGLWVAGSIHPSPLGLTSVRDWCSPPEEVLGLPVPFELLMPLLGICAEEEIQRERKLCVSGKAIPSSLTCRKKLDMTWVSPWRKSMRLLKRMVDRTV